MIVRDKHAVSRSFKGNNCIKIFCKSPNKLPQNSYSWDSATKFNIKRIMTKSVILNPFSSLIHILYKWPFIVIQRSKINLSLLTTYLQFYLLLAIYKHYRPKKPSQLDGIIHYRTGQQIGLDVQRFRTIHFGWSSCHVPRQILSGVTAFLDQTMPHF